MARWESCNILQTGGAANRVWQFNRHFALGREQTCKPGEPLPASLVGKTWSTLLRPRLNVAWLPPEHVFIRVAQFPPSTPEETRTMVELQLEKLSPIPVTQAVWSMHLLPATVGNLQTVIITIAERSAVEEFLGKLEAQGFMADGLELPMLDQLQATTPNANGAWVYPEAAGGKNTALVAWWYGGALQSVGIVTVSAGEDRTANLRDQLVHMAWAGELEGWLTSPPEWHLVANPEVAAEWESALREGLGTTTRVVAPLTKAELAARTAKRMAESGGVNLLPPDYAKRYQQQFIDRLWMRGLGALLGIYVVCCLVYFTAVQVLSYRTSKVEETVALQGMSYTNALQLKARYEVLKDRQALKFAALNAYNAVADTLPTGATLESMNFNDGKRVMVAGTAPSAQATEMIDFSGKIRKWVNPIDNQPLFSNVSTDPYQSSQMPGGNIRWNFGLELKKGEKD